MMDEEDLIPIEQVLLDMESDSDVISSSAKAYFELNYKNKKKEK